MVSNNWEMRCNWLSLLSKKLDKLLGFLLIESQCLSRSKSFPEEQKYASLPFVLYMPISGKTAKMAMTKFSHSSTTKIATKRCSHSTTLSVTATLGSSINTMNLGAGNTNCVFIIYITQMNLPMVILQEGLNQTYRRKTMLNVKSKIRVSIHDSNQTL